MPTLTRQVLLTLLLLLPHSAFCFLLVTYTPLRYVPQHRLPALLLRAAAGIAACWADRPLLQALHEVLQPPSANLLLVQWSRQQELLQVGLQLAARQPPLPA